MNKTVKAILQKRNKVKVDWFMERFIDPKIPVTVFHYVIEERLACTEIKYWSEYDRYRESLDVVHKGVIRAWSSKVKISEHNDPNGYSRQIRISPIGLAKNKQQNDITNMNGSGLPIAQKNRGMMADAMVDMGNEMMLMGEVATNGRPATVKRKRGPAIVSKICR